MWSIVRECARGNIASDLLDGLFLARAFAHFPIAVSPFRVYAALTGGRGEGLMELACMELESERDIYYHKKWIAFPESAQTNHYVIPVRKLIIPAPGRYRLTMSFDKQEIAFRIFDVKGSAMIPPVIETDTDVLIIVEDGEEEVLTGGACKLPQATGAFRSGSVSADEFGSDCHGTAKLAAQGSSKYPEARHRLMSTGQVRNDLADLYRRASVELRAKITSTCTRSEHDYRRSDFLQRPPLFDFPIKPCKRAWLSFCH